MIRPGPRRAARPPMATARRKGTMSIRTPRISRRPRLLAPLLLLAGASLLPCARDARAADAEQATGTWMVESWTNKNDETTYALELRWSHGRDHWGGRSVKLDKVPGLTPAQLKGEPSSVHFEMKRDAGTFVCDGHVGNEEGAGLYVL